MPEVPTPKELRRIFRRMELVERYRLSKIAATGRVADDPAEAALVAAAARRGLRQLPWLIVSMIGLFGLQVITIATTDDKVVRWLSVAIMVIIPASIATVLLRGRPRLLRGASQSGISGRRRFGNSLTESWCLWPHKDKEEPMPGTPRFFETSEYPPEAGRVQLTLHIDVFSDREGGCAIGFSAPEGSELVAKYGGKGRALAACRDVIVGDLDFLIKEFYDEA